MSREVASSACVCEYMCERVCLRTLDLCVLLKERHTLGCVSVVYNVHLTLHMYSSFLEV